MFESGSGNFSNLRIRLLFRLRLQSIQAKFIHAFSKEMRLLLLSKFKSDPGPVFPKFLTPDQKEKCRILPESSPDPWPSLAATMKFEKAILRKSHVVPAFFNFFRVTMCNGQWLTLLH